MTGFLGEGDGGGVEQHQTTLSLSVCVFYHHLQVHCLFYGTLLECCCPTQFLFISQIIFAMTQIITRKHIDYYTSYHIMYK